MQGAKEKWAFLCGRMRNNVKTRQQLQKQSIVLVQSLWLRTLVVVTAVERGATRSIQRVESLNAAAPWFSPRVSDAKVNKLCPAPGSPSPVTLY